MPRITQKAIGVLLISIVVDIDIVGPCTVNLKKNFHKEQINKLDTFNAFNNSHMVHCVLYILDLL